LLKATNYLYKNTFLLLTGPDIYDLIAAMRTKGATSHIAVKLSDLTKRLQPDAIVYIWRRQADQLGIGGKADYANNSTLGASGNTIAVEESIVIQEAREEAYES